MAKREWSWTTDVPGELHMVVIVDADTLRWGGDGPGPGNAGSMDAPAADFLATGRPPAAYGFVSPPAAVLDELRRVLTALHRERA